MLPKTCEDKYKTILQELSSRIPCMCSRSFQSAQTAYEYMFNRTITTFQYIYEDELHTLYYNINPRKEK